MAPRNMNSSISRRPGTDDHPTDPAELTIVDALQARTEPFPPADLIAQLEAAGFPNPDIRAAIWRLLDRHRIQLTVDLRLTMPDHVIDPAGQIA